MKNSIILTIVAVTLMAFNCSAQNENENKNDLRTRLILGFKAGVNFSNVYNSAGESFDADSKFGFATGAFLAIPFGKYFGIQPEILYSQKGFKGTGMILGGTYKFTRTTNYIDVPLLFSLKPSEFFTIVAGPQYSYLIGQKDVFANATTTIEQEQEFENDNLRKNTMCLTGGLDITIKHIVLGARVGWDVLNNSGDGTTTTPRYKNVWGQATIGYRFFRNNK